MPAEAFDYHLLAHRAERLVSSHPTVESRAEYAAEPVPGPLERADMGLVTRLHSECSVFDLRERSVGGNHLLLQRDATGVWRAGGQRHSWREQPGPRLFAWVRLPRNVKSHRFSEGVR